MRPFSAMPMQPVLVDVGDHLVEGRPVRLDVQDWSLFRGLGSEESRPDRLRFRRV